MTNTFAAASNRYDLKNSPFVALRDTFECRVSGGLLSNVRSDRLSVVGCRLSVVGCRLSIVGCQLSTGWPCDLLAFGNFAATSPCAREPCMARSWITSAQLTNSISEVENLLGSA